MSFPILNKIEEDHSELHSALAHICRKKNGASMKDIRKNLALFSKNEDIEEAIEDLESNGYVEYKDGEYHLIK